MNPFYGQINWEHPRKAGGYSGRNVVKKNNNKNEDNNPKIIKISLNANPGCHFTMTLLLTNITLPNGEVAKDLNCSLEVHEFELLLLFAFKIGLLILGKGLDPLILPNMY